MSNTTFSEHAKGVFCIDVSNDEKYILSGGEDDLAYIWNSKGELIEFYNTFNNNCGM